MTPTQCRMARSAIKWSTSDLSKKARVTTTTVNRFENGKDAYTSTAIKLKKALESSGKIRFEGGCCVCVVEEEGQ